MEDEWARMVAAGVAEFEACNYDIVWVPEGLTYSVMVERVFKAMNLARIPDPLLKLD